MIGSHKFDGYLKQVRNPDSPLTEAESAAAQSVIERRLEQIAKENGRLRDGRPAEIMKKLRGDTTEIFTEAFPNFGSRRKQIVDKYKPELEKVRLHVASIIWDDLDLDFGGIGNESFEHVTPPPPPPPPGIGDFWWDQTIFFSTFREILVEQPDELVRIFGHLHWGGDSLLTGSVGFIQNFVLSPDRFPSTGETSFVVRASLRNIGVISGFTGFYHPFWAADDKWCKCQWLVTARLFAPLGSASISDPPANTLSRVESGTDVILNLDNESPVGQENKALSPIVGRMLMFGPAHLPTLAAFGAFFLVQIENRFNIQLEGDADIWFTGNGGEPSLENAARVQTAPIKLETRLFKP
jgi:hypothetical protein